MKLPLGHTLQYLAPQCQLRAGERLLIGTEDCPISMGVIKEVVISLKGPSYVEVAPEPTEINMGQLLSLVCEHVTTIEDKERKVFTHTYQPVFRHPLGEL